MSIEMKEKEVIQKIRSAAKPPVSCDEERREDFIAAVLARDIPVSKKGSFWEFLLSQANFINKTAFFWQALWLMGFFFVIWMGQRLYVSNETLCILSMAPPLLLLLTVEEVTHVYNRSMLEIEYVTKYSLQKVVMVRMLILSLLNGIFLLPGIAYAKSRIGLGLTEVIAYGLMPLILMTGILLMLMRKFSGERLKYAGAVVYVFLAGLLYIGRMERWNIYRRELLGAWLLLLVCGMAIVVYQAGKLKSHLESYELMAE